MSLHSAWYHPIWLGPLVAVLWTTPVAAQGTKRPAVQSTKSLDAAAEKAENDYLANLADLASKYEEAGDLQKAGGMLRSILKIKPDAEVVKNKLKLFEEAVFKDNVQTIEVEAGAGWVSAGVLVSKDKPVRIEAEGTYKFSVSDLLGPAGYPSDDLLHGMIEGIPCGGLMVVIGKSGESNRRDAKDLPHPQYVGASKEIVPKESGPLLFRLNVPDGSKCTGKVKVKVTGNIAALPR